MSLNLIKIIEKSLDRQVAATGLGLFRICIGLVITLEVAFLFYFRHLIFDLTPFLDRASTCIHLILIGWMIIAVCLTIGYKTRISALLNYILWVVFVVFTTMWEDFDGGFDQLIIGTSLMLIFVPSERAFSIDNLSLRLRTFKPDQDWQPERTVPVFCYHLIVFFSLALLYLDSLIHKLFAEHWLNGMGAWLPSSMPYYISALDVSWLLNQKVLMQCTGHLILIFQLVFPFVFFRRWARIPLLVIGTCFHLGITLLLNIYPFGLAMLAHYLLLVPFAWWRCVGNHLSASTPRLTVYFDGECPLCCRTVAIIQHFSLGYPIEFKSLQNHSGSQPLFHKFKQSVLLKDLYAVDHNKQLYSGLDTYIKILHAMGYLKPAALLLSIPGIYHISKAVYRRIADNRTRQPCTEICLSKPKPVRAQIIPDVFTNSGPGTRQKARKLYKVIVIVLVLQLNVTIVHGLIHRIPNSIDQTAFGQILLPVSGTLALFSHSLLGITPHALYLHDHFEGFNHILAFTYLNDNGQEQWVPYVNEQGRMLAPHWGRVHSMWANIGFTARIIPWRMNKAIRRISAYWCHNLGFELIDCRFTVKMKKIISPTDWVYDLRQKNLSGSWKTIGFINWNNNELTIDLPDIEQL